MPMIRGRIDEKTNPLGNQWIIDEEQTDNFVSPWDTISSALHGVWRKHNPRLASLVNPRVRRGFIDPNALEEAPESMEVSPGDSEKKVVMSVLKRLLSNEAYTFFYHPVPPSDKDYHDTVPNATCLQHIIQRINNGEYLTYMTFQNDIELMLSHSLEVCDESSSAFIMCAMVQKDLGEARDEIVRNGLGHMLDMNVTEDA